MDCAVAVGCCVASPSFGLELDRSGASTIIPLVSMRPRFTTNDHRSDSLASSQVRSIFP